MTSLHLHIVHGSWAYRGVQHHFSIPEKRKAFMRKWVALKKRCVEDMFSTKLFLGHRGSVSGFAEPIVIYRTWREGGWRREDYVLSSELITQWARLNWLQIKIQRSYTCDSTSNHLKISYVQINTGKITQLIILGAYRLLAQEQRGSLASRDDIITAQTGQRKYVRESISQTHKSCASLLGIAEWIMTASGRVDFWGG